MYATVGALGFLSYLPSLSGGFVWDDASLFAGGWLAQPGALATIWLRPGEIETEEHYWPVLYTLFYLQHLLWGSEAVGYRLVNMVLHAGNGMLLLALLRQHGVPWAFAAAALFAVHPVHVESVAWIIELKDVLSSCFILAAMLAFGAFLHAGGARAAQAGWLILALVLFAAALGSKSVAVVTPVALAIICWWRTGGLARRALVALTPFMLLTVVFIAVDLRLVADANNPRMSLGVLERLEVAGRALWFYVATSFWPVGLTPIYPKWAVGGGPVAGLAPAAVAGVLMAALVVASNRIGRGPAALTLLFAVGVLPTLGLVPFTFQQYSFVADRYLYLPVACATVAVAAGALRLHERLTAPVLRAVPALVLTVLVAVLTVQTWFHIAVYRDNESWARAVLARNPQAAIGHQLLGVTLLGRGDVAGALPHLEAAVQQQPGNPSSHYNLAVAHAMAGRRDDALVCIGRALAVDPSHHNSIALRDRLTTPAR